MPRSSPASSRRLRPIRRPPTSSAAGRGGTSSCRRCSTRARSIAPRGSARASKISLIRGTLAPSEPHGQYFKEQVRQELFDRFGSERVYRGGLRVFTTYDLPMQQAAETAVRDQLNALEERRRAIYARRAKPQPN